MLRFFISWSYLMALTIAPSFAGSSLTLTGVGGENASLAPASVTYNATAQGQASSGSHTYSNVSIGTASADRIVVISLAYASATGSVSVSVGGNSATLITRETMGVSSWVALFYVAIPTGTTANVVVSGTSATGWSRIGSYSIYGAGGVVDSGEASTNPATINLSGQNGGVIIAASISGGGSPVTTWTNATKNYDAVLTTTFFSSGASDTTGGNVTLGASFSPAPLSGQATIGATFR